MIQGRGKAWFHPVWDSFARYRARPASILRRSSRCARRDPCTVDRSLCRAGKRYCFRNLLKDKDIIPRFGALSTVLSIRASTPSARLACLLSGRFSLSFCAGFILSSRTLLTCHPERFPPCHPERPQGVKDLGTERLLRGDGGVGIRLALRDSSSLRSSE